MSSQSTPSLGPKPGHGVRAPGGNHETGNGAHPLRARRPWLSAVRVLVLVLVTVAAAMEAHPR